MINKINLLPNQEQENITEENLLNFLESNSLEKIKNINPPLTFDMNHNAISYWNDMDWNFKWNKDYDIDYKFVFNWNTYSQLNSNYIEELKYLLVVIYYKKYKYHKNSKFIQSIALHLSIFLEQCQLLNFSSINSLSDDLNLIAVLEKIKGKYAFGTLTRILISLRYINEINSPYFSANINIAKNGVNNNKGFDIKDLAKKYSTNQDETVNQTLYIPSSIHSKLISTCIDFIEKNKSKLDNMMSFLEEDFLLYEKIKNELKIDKVDATNYEKVRWRKRFETKKFLVKYQLEDFSSMIDVEREVRLLAVACSILILNFSGMRINELCNIKTNGFSIINSDPILYVIRTFETKISGGQIVDYVTSPIVKEAFDNLIKIHSFAKKYDNTIEEKDLFIVSQNQKLLSYGNPGVLGVHINDFATSINLTIDHEDVKESELLNGPREEIKVGNIWPLLSHQFRRTLIVNFVSHRLGSINAVKQQVKHMYATMTEYYAKNSNLANTFNLNIVKEITEIIEEELLNEGVRQYKQFYYSEEPLAGIKGQEIMEERQTIKVLSDEEIKQLFKTGLYKISRSMYGYCTKGNLCDKKEVIDPTFCGASCSTMVITQENANNWQKLYFRNYKLLENDLNIGGISMSSAKTTMQSQNEVAKKIMDQFNMKYED